MADAPKRTTSETGLSTASTRLDSSSSDDETNSPRESESTPMECDPKLWYIHGHSYDLSGFVDKHPGGRLAILSGRGRDCTALFESYHPWNDRHRKTLKAYGPPPPTPDPFYEELKQEVRKVYPRGKEETKMHSSSLAMLCALQALNIYLFFVVRTPLSCLVAGCLMAMFGTRLAHEGGHFQISHRPWVNRLVLFYGYFPTGPSMCWHYQHVISHHAHTNQEHDVDVSHIWLADKLPGWLKAFGVVTLPFGAMLEIGLKRIVWDIFTMRHVGGNYVDFWLGGLLPEALVWFVVHGWVIYLHGLVPSLIGYTCYYLTAGAIFVPCSQVAHAILYPDFQKHNSWAKMQIAESADFATDSDFWFHVAFGLTTQIEHHLFPSLAHHCYDHIRHGVRRVCEKNGVPYIDLPAKKAFGALWHRWVAGEPMRVA